MLGRSAAIILVAYLAVVVARPASAVVIDDFSAGPLSLEAIRYQPKSVTVSSLPVDQTVGGSRAVGLSALGPTAASSVRVSVDTDASEFRYDADPGATAANFLVRYGTTQNLQANLLADGANAIVFDFAFANFESGGGNFDLQLVTQPGSRYLYWPIANSTVPFSLVVPYRAFTSSSGSVNLANVSSFSWGTGNGNLRGDFSLSGIRTAFYPDGDFNFDGSVDAQDYQLWRSSYGQTSWYPVMAADGNRDGKVDAADFVLWRRGASSASGMMFAAVPEPGVWCVVGPAALCAAAFRVRPTGKF